MNTIRPLPCRRLPVALFIGLLLVLFFFFVFLYSSLLSFLLPIGGEQPVAVSNSFGFYLMEEISLLLAVLTAGSLCFGMEGQSLGGIIGTLKGHFREFLWGSLGAVLLYAVGFAVSVGGGWVRVEGFHWNSTALLQSFLFFILVAFTEEILFRGCILERLLQVKVGATLLRQRLHRLLSLLVSSALFALLHLLNPHISLLPMVNITLAGILLGALYLYTRSLAASVGLHLFWNWIQGPVLGYEVSGNELFPGLVQQSLPVDTLMNGGAFGFEGSLLCTLLLLVTIVAVVYWGEMFFLQRR